MTTGVSNKIQAVVLDNGSGYCKVGLAGYDSPRSVFATLVGRPRHACVLNGGGLLGNSKQLYLGDEALVKRSTVALSRPISHGHITNWDDMERLWEHAFYSELVVSPEEHPVLLTETPLNPKSTRERTTEVFFEKLAVPALYMGTQALMSLYASGRITGVVVDCGDGMTHTVPIYEGYQDSHALMHMELAGRDVTEHLQRLLAAESGHHLAADLELVRDMKEKFAFVALDYQQQLNDSEQDNNNNTGEVIYDLPDGTELVVGSERFRCAEILFQPSLIGVEGYGVHDILYQSIDKCARDIKKHLYANMVLAGGSTMFDGFAERMKSEMTKLVPSSMKINLVAPENRKYSVWLGGSILSSLSTFQTMWISRSDYDEQGPPIVNKKCVQ